MYTYTQDVNQNHHQKSPNTTNTTHTNNTKQHRTTNTDNLQKNGPHPTYSQQPTHKHPPTHQPTASRWQQAANPNPQDVTSTWNQTTRYLVPKWLRFLYPALPEQTDLTQPGHDCDIQRFLNRPTQSNPATIVISSASWSDRFNPTRPRLWYPAIPKQAEYHPIFFKCPYWGSNPGRLVDSCASQPTGL